MKFQTQRGAKEMVMITAAELEKRFGRGDYSVFETSGILYVNESSVDDCMQGRPLNKESAMRYLCSDYEKRVIASGNPENKSV